MHLTASQVNKLVGTGFDYSEDLAYINDNLDGKDKREFSRETLKEYVLELIDDLYAPEGSP